MAKSTKVRKVEVTWLDAHSPRATDVFNIDDITALDEIHSPLEVTTIGWVLRDNDKGITLANEDCGDGDYRGLTFILRILIVEVKSVATVRAKKVKKAEEPRVGSIEGYISGEEQQ